MATIASTKTTATTATIPSSNTTPSAPAATAPRLQLDQQQPQVLDDPRKRDAPKLPFGEPLVKKLRCPAKVSGGHAGNGATVASTAAARPSQIDEYKEMYVESQVRARRLEKDLEESRAERAKLQAQLAAFQAFQQRATTTTKATTKKARSSRKKGGGGEKKANATAAASSGIHGSPKSLTDEAASSLLKQLGRPDKDQKIAGCDQKSTLQAKTTEKKGMAKSSTAKDDLWELRFNELQQYSRKFGDCMVPRKYAPNPDLGIFCMTQRTQYRCYKNGRASYMTPERIIRLSAIGFCFDRSAPEAAPAKKGEAAAKKTPRNGSGVDIWDARYAELVEYQHLRGNCDVPLRYPPNPALGRFVGAMRSSYKSWTKKDESGGNGTGGGGGVDAAVVPRGGNASSVKKKRKSNAATLTQDRVDKLNGLGFKWSLKQQDEEYERTMEELWEKLYHPKAEAVESSTKVQAQVSKSHSQSNGSSPVKEIAGDK